MTTATTDFRSRTARFFIYMVPALVDRSTLNQFHHLSFIVMFRVACF
jgi:hypothetical protein